MSADPDIEALHTYYELGKELDRLASPSGELEFERTKEIVLRHLPPPPAVVADIGGGPGAYSLWLDRTRLPGRAPRQRSPARRPAPRRGRRSSSDCGG